ncbi:MAG: tetratricopeptide repeat protein [Bacteroidia bacterium]
MTFVLLEFNYNYFTLRSMETENENIEEQIKYIDEMNLKIWNLRGSPESEFDALTVGKEILEKTTILNYTFGRALALLNLGMGNFIVNNEFNKAVEQINEALSIFREQDDKKWIANALITLGIVNNTIGKTEDALYSTLRGITYYENGQNEGAEKVMAYYILGTIYKDLKKYDEAEKNYLIGIANPVGNSTWFGRIFLGLSTIYLVKEKYDEAIKMTRKGLDILKADKNKIGESRALNDLGIIYKKQKKYDEALVYFLEALQIRESHQIVRFAVSSYIEISALYNEMGDLKEAINYLKKAETVASEIKFQVKLAQIYQQIAEIYKAQGDHQQVLFYYEKLMKVNEDLYHQDTEDKINSLTKELVKEKEAEIERIKNVELKAAYDTIEIKNKEILDSINYAKRIQFVLLANTEILKANLKEHYVFFKPKDIVSGDFYWATKKNDNFYLAICDSTGHGVPGAFMSLLNMSFLNEAINEKNILEPNEVFNHIRKRLISHMDGGRDGMDAILVCFNKKNNTLTYSAANNTPIVIRENKILEMPFDKMPIGKGETNESFKNHSVKLETGDNLYLYTDGYADQFGGPNGKKFKCKPLNEMLLSISKNKMEEQVKSLEQKFMDWKGNLEQVDDVCIIGIKI